MLKESFSSISKKMVIDFVEMTSRISHNGERGNAREDMLSDYLRQYLPEKYKLSKGIVIDSKDTQSRQVDIIIHDKDCTPYLQQYDSTVIVPIETVACTIEVKSSLDKSELEKSIENVSSVRKLKKQSVNGRLFPTAGMVFAFDSTASMDTLYSNFVSMVANYSPEERPSCLCVLGKGLIVCADKADSSRIVMLPSGNTYYALLKNSNDSLLIFYLLLMQVLSSSITFVPNMMEYAQVSEKIDMTLSVLNGYLPSDARFRFGNDFYEYRQLEHITSKAQKMLRGESTESSFAHDLFGLYIPFLELIHKDLNNVNQQNASIDYYGTKINGIDLIHMYRIWKCQNPSEEEKLYLKEKLQEMYVIYDSYRNEMKKNI